MKREIAEKWTAALRSGEYEQGQGQLHKRNIEFPDCFCCLGVLCELAVEEGVIQKAILVDNEDYAYGFDEGETLEQYCEALGLQGPYGDTFQPTLRVQRSYLPEAVRLWAGMQENNGKFPGCVTDEDTGSDGLAEMNDCGMSFEYIAEAIEEHMEEL